MWRIKSGIENPSKSEVIGRFGGDEKTEWPRRTDKSRMPRRILKIVSFYYIADSTKLMRNDNQQLYTTKRSRMHIQRSRTVWKKKKHRIKSQIPRNSMTAITNLIHEVVWWYKKSYL